MKSSHYPIIVLALLISNLCANAQEAANMKKDIEQTPIVVFVCEHGSAKSVVAAAHFNRMAAERNLKLRAISRGTSPDAEIAPKAAKGLEGEGLSAGEQKPMKLSAEDFASSALVVAFCRLPDACCKPALVEQWDDVPPVSEDYSRARDAIVARIGRLLDELISAKKR